MLLIPAIDIFNEECVRLRQGNYSQKTVFDKNPIEIAQRWVDEGAQRIHLVDLNGAKDGVATNYKIIEKIKKNVGNVEIEIGGGIRKIETIEKYISCGIDYVIIGTKAVQSPKFLSQVCAKFGLKIILGIDSRDGYVAVEGWEKTSKLSTVNFAIEAQEAGVKQIIYTDISTDGMMKGPNLKGTTDLAKSLNIPVIASGGISSENDVMNYLSNEKYGINGVIIGRALYENKISFSKLINKLHKK